MTAMSWQQTITESCGQSLLASRYRTNWSCGACGAACRHAIAPVGCFRPLPRCPCSIGCDWL